MTSSRSVGEDTGAGFQAQRNLVRWGAVFSGAVVGLGVFVLLTALWLALAYGSGIRWWQSSLNWWVGATGILAMFVAGLLSGYLSGARGIVAGLANSVTVWGLATLAIVLSGVPVGLGLLRAVRRALAVPSSSLWTVFWSLLIGLGAVAIGGVVGGAAGRWTGEHGEPRTLPRA